MKKFNKVTAVCLVFFMILSLLPEVVFAPPSESGGQIYKILRVYDEEGAVTIYRVPVPEEELEFLSNMRRGGFQAFNDEPFPFPYTRIRYSGLPREDSIVIVLLGDGFAEDAYGTWPNPAPETVLWHMDRVMTSMLNTHPFALFEDLFTVYVIHTPEINPVTGFRGYLGSIIGPSSAYEGHLNRDARQFRWVRVYQLADALIPPDQQNMIQVLTNTHGGGGFASSPDNPIRNAAVAVTGISNNSVPIGGSSGVWPNGTRFHGVFLHEFGHSFGNLMDENVALTFPGYQIRESMANVTMAPDAEVKWRHWSGHRNVLHVPFRVPIGWGIPTNPNDLSYGANCIMGSSNLNRAFCGVCTAELIRRLAFLSGETFIGRSPDGNAPLPNTPTIVIPQGATRILDSAFHGNTSLQTIHIPDSVETIGDFAFIGATGLQTIINNSTIPQPINQTTFAGVDRSAIDLFVPEGTRDAFYAAGWTGFREIRTGYYFHAITYNPNGGTPATQIIDTVARGSNHQLRPANTFVRSRHTFEGWATTSSGPAIVMHAPGETISDIQNDLTLYARWYAHYADDIVIVPSDRDDAYINLTDETIALPADFTVAGFSVNNGRRWRRGALPTGRAWNNLFNRQMTLIVSDSVTPRGRVSPTSGANQIVFSPIQARPRRNPERLRPFFSDDDTWTLMTRRTRANPIPQPSLLAHEFVRGTTTGAFPENPAWEPMTDFEVLTRPPRGERNSVHFRTAASVREWAGRDIYTPSSRVFRINPRAFGNAPNLRINYNTELIRLRRSHKYSLDGGETWTPPALEANRPVPLDVSNHITSGTAIMIRTATTGGRPGSMTQTITPQARAPLAENLPLELNILSNGRIDPDALRPYRAWINNSWRAVPRINANNAGTHQIRLHPTARISGGAWSGNAASETGTLHTAWGEIGRDSRGRPIMGVTRAVITAYGETPPPVAPPSAPPPYAEIPDATTPPAVQMNSTTDPALQMDVVTEEDLPVDVDVTTEAAVQIE